MDHSALTDGTVSLRSWRASDVRSLAATYTSLDVPPAFEPRKIALTTDDAQRFIDQRLAALAAGVSGSFAIVSAGNGRLLGACSVVTEGPTVGRLGYWIARPSRGRGYLTRALRILIPWATRDAGLRRLHIITRPNNGPSRGVAEHAGFVLVGTSTEIVRGTPRQVVRYEYEAD